MAQFHLDKASSRVSHPIMRCKPPLLQSNPHRYPAKLALATFALTIVSATTGCLSALKNHSLALAAATAPVVDEAAAAYRSANAIHTLRTDYDAVAQFDSPPPAPVYNPRTIQPLISDKDIQVRLTVLAAFQSYVQSLVAITSDTDSPQLQAAARSTGQSLTGLGNTIAPSIESTFGIAVAPSSTTETTVSSTTDGVTTATSTSSTSPTDPLTPAVRNGISTAVDALGQFLINRKLKKDLPPIIVSMDPEVKLLCELLESDITILQGVEDRDYNSIINRQTLFLRESANRMDPGERRELIMQLPAIVRQRQESDRQLKLLSAALVRLELTHHALAAEAQGNNPETLRQKLGDLEAAGANLGSFYSSLPSR